MSDLATTEPIISGGRAKTLLATLANDPKITFVAHGAGFEKAIWRKLMVTAHGFTDIPNSRWRCTMAACAYKSLPLALDDAVKSRGLSEAKDAEGSRVTRSLSRPNRKGYYTRSDEKLKRVYAYNLQDIVAEEGLLKDVGYLPPHEQRVWLLDQRINERGVKIDRPLIERMLSIAEAASYPLRDEFFALTGVNVNQRDKLLGWCAAQGNSLPNLTKETVTALIGEIEEEPADLESDDFSYSDYATREELKPQVERALKIRAELTRASIKKLGRMLQCAEHDDRVRGLVQYHGAHTGRWTGRLFQPQNFPTASLESDPEEVVATLLRTNFPEIEGLSALDIVSRCLRYTLIPEYDRCYVAGDFSTIELRVLLALAGQWDKIDLIQRGEDPYLDMATQIFRPEKPLTKADNPKERDVGKHAVLGLGYGMGHKKFLGMYARERSLDFGQTVVETYRDIWAPQVKKVWWAFDDAALSAVVKGITKEAFGVEFKLEGDWMTARLPSGRKIWYHKPRAEKKAMPWDHRDIRQAWSYEGVKSGRRMRVDAFGGMLTGHIVQGMARDLMVAAMFKCEANNLPVVLTVHDEIVCEPLKEHGSTETLSQIMADSPDWARDMQVPVTAKCWTGQRYRKE